MAENSPSSKAGLRVGDKLIQVSVYLCVYVCIELFMSISGWVCVFVCAFFYVSLATITALGKLVI